MSVKLQSYRGTPPQKPIKPLFSVPVFKDSLKLTRDIRNFHTLRKIYNALKKENVGTVYQYGFSIDTTGHIILGMKEDRIYLHELNEYIESIFKNYTWIPSHKLDCKTCFVMQLADLSINLTQLKTISVVLLRSVDLEGRLFTRK